MPARFPRGQTQLKVIYEIHHFDDGGLISHQPYISQEEIHAGSVARGFWPDTARADLERIPVALMLVVTELAEAMEDWRDGALATVQVNGKPCGFPSELADVVIRCRDIAAALGIDLEAEIVRKHDYNQTRPHLHGRKH